MDILPKKYTGIVLIWLFALFLISSPSSAQEQEISTFSGKVTEMSTGAPIPGVSVYIAGSTSGSSTDASGRYHFETQLTGDHYLVFSLVGYKTQPHPIELKAGRSYNTNVELKRVTIQLKEVEVISSNEEWKRNFAYFRRHFIGTTEFAGETRINNPWVLDFEREEHVLRSYSNKPILVSNRALGYQIRIELLQFEWNTETNLGVYKVFTHFNEMRPNNTYQKREWERNRINTFLGSKAHFFRSLYRGDWKEKNYSVSTEDHIYRLSEQDLKYYFYTAVSPIYRIPGEWEAFRLENYVTIKYEKKLPNVSDFSDNIIWVQKTAGIESNRKDKIFLINKWGLLKDIESVFLHGVWGRNRIANSLPNNFTYTPEKEARQAPSH